MSHSDAESRQQSRMRIFVLSGFYSSLFDDALQSVKAIPCRRLERKFKILHKSLSIHNGLSIWTECALDRRMHLSASDSCHSLQLTAWIKSQLVTMHQATSFSLFVHRSLRKESHFDSNLITPMAGQANQSSPPCVIRPESEQVIITTNNWHEHWVGWTNRDAGIEVTYVHATELNICCSYFAFRTILMILGPMCTVGTRCAYIVSPVSWENPPIFHKHPENLLCPRRGERRFKRRFPQKKGKRGI